MKKIYFLWIVLFALFSAPVMAQKKYAVVIYGGTPGGIAAAVAASRQGASVVLIEPTKHVGGLNTSGIGTAETEHMIEETISGLPLEFYTQVGRNYGLSKPAFYFESHVAEQVFNQLLDSAHVPVVFEGFVKKVNKLNGVIKAIDLTNGQTIHGDVFIDASYEGDLMARAGVSYTYGRESTSQYNESLAGIRLLDKPIDVSPYDEEGRLLPGFVETSTLKNGEASKRVINYNFRLMLSTRDSKIPFPAPKHYDPKRFLLLKRLLTNRPQTKLEDIIDLYSWNYPQGKFEANNKQNSLISLGLFGGNIDYPDADYKARAAIYQDHKDWTLGLFYFLLNDPAVPAGLKAETSRYGLAADEFKDNHNFPYYLYVREARRMIGDYVHTQQDIFTDPYKKDAIALGSHFVDCHHVQRVAVSKTQYVNEGRIWVKVEQPYEISYRSIIPKQKECTNLLVPVAASASHVAFCSFRVEVTWMQLGQAAGIAAGIAAKTKKPVQQVDINALQLELKKASVIFHRDAQKWHTDDKI